NTFTTYRIVHATRTLRFLGFTFTLTVHSSCMKGSPVGIFECLVTGFLVQLSLILLVHLREQLLVVPNVYLSGSVHQVDRVTTLEHSELLVSHPRVRLSEFLSGLVDDVLTLFPRVRVIGHTQRVSR